MNRILLVRIAERLNAEDSLVVNVLLGSDKNAGVVNRIAEEKGWHDRNNIAYDPKWVEYFPSEIRSILEAHAGVNNRTRIRVRQIESCPTVGVIKADNRTFIFLYGAPSMRGGSESPWIELDARESSGVLNQFVARYLAHFMAESRHISTATPSNSLAPGGGSTSAPKGP